MYSESEIESLKQITLVYGKIKKLILFCEENNEEFKSNIQVVKELRDAFDHLMRVFAVQFELKTGVDELYIKRNIDKTLGHVFRAGYDTLDYTGIILRDKIAKELDGFSSDTIQAAIPDYYSEKRPELEEITDKIVYFRDNKDVDNPSYEILDEYFEIIQRFDDIYKNILKAKPAMVELQTHDKRKKWSLAFNELVVGLILIIIGVILGKLFV